MLDAGSGARTLALPYLPATKKKECSVNDYDRRRHWRQWLLLWRLRVARSDAYKVSPTVLQDDSHLAGVVGSIEWQGHPVRHAVLQWLRHCQTCIGAVPYARVQADWRRELVLIRPARRCSLYGFRRTRGVRCQKERTEKQDDVCYCSH